MAKRSGPVATLAKIVFALPFVGVGGWAFVAAFRDVAGGTGASWVGMVFGGIFLFAGGMIIRGALLDTQSPEARAAKKRRALPKSDVLPPAAERDVYRHAAGLSRSARELYADVLDTAPVQRLETLPGRVLARTISLHSTASTAAEVVFMVVWNGITWPFFLVMVESRNLLGSLFLLLFVSIGSYVTFAFVRRRIGRRRLPRVEISAEPTYLGDELSIHVDQSGPARVTRYRIGVSCKEVVRYSVGTSSRSEEHVVFERTLFDEPGRSVARGEHWTHDLVLTLPADAPASFASENNQLLWLVTVHAEIAGWPDYDEGFSFRALPRPAT